jgi:two-component system response regulator RegA
MDNLLIVDDDQVFRERLVKAFQLRGYLVSSASSLEGANLTAREFKPQLAIIDLRLGVDSGLDVLKDLLKITPNLRAIVLTGYGSIATAIEAVKIGAINYLTKPVEISQLLEAFESKDAAADISPQQQKTPKQVPTLEQVEWDHLQRVLSDCNGNITQAAKLLKLHRRSLQRKLAKAPSS